MAKKPQVEDDVQVQGAHPAAQAPAKQIKQNRTFWKILLLPSLLILAIIIGLYFLRPLRDQFIRGDIVGSYLLFGTYAAYSPKFWMIGLSSILFAVWLILAIGRTVARGEWGYWQRILGLLALTASGVLLVITGLPEIGTDARDAGWTSLNGHFYHLLVQDVPGSPGTIQRFSIYDCDQAAATCHLVKVEDKRYEASDRIPPLDVLQINVDGQVIVARGNSPEYYTLYRPQ